VQSAERKESNVPEKNQMIQSTGAQRSKPLTTGCITKCRKQLHIKTSKSKEW
jgi:hypothetical protein